MRRTVVVLVWGVVAVVVGCRPGERVMVPLRGTQPNSTISGTATLTQTAEGLKVVVQVANVPPGDHGVHIHEKGTCGEAGNAAGGHYNPAQVKHGLVTRDGVAASHVGDFGNITVDANGRGTLQLLVRGLTLRGGQYPVAGRAIIVHEQRDDFGQPTGNAGGRIACGVIPHSSP